MAERNGFGQRHVEPERSGNRHGDLGNFESVSEPRALVVLRKYKHLGFASQASERRRMQDAITVALKAGAKRIGLFSDGTIASAKRAGGMWCQHGRFECLASITWHQLDATSASPRVGMSKPNAAVGGVAMHSCCPRFGA
jgi:hypothetical protein